MTKVMGKSMSKLLVSDLFSTWNEIKQIFE